MAKCPAARDFFSNQGDLTQPYFVYPQENPRRVAEKDPPLGHFDIFQTRPNAFSHQVKRKRTFSMRGVVKGAWAITLLDEGLPIMTGKIRIGVALVRKYRMFTVSDPFPFPVHSLHVEHDFAKSYPRQSAPTKPFTTRLRSFLLRSMGAQRFYQLSTIRPSCGLGPLSLTLSSSFSAESQRPLGRAPLCWRPFLVSFFSRSCWKLNCGTNPSSPQSQPQRP